MGCGTGVWGDSCGALRVKITRRPCFFFFSVFFHLRSSFYVISGSLGLHGYLEGTESI
jgi:hypothetical protein